MTIERIHNFWPVDIAIFPKKPSEEALLGYLEDIRPNFSLGEDWGMILDLTTGSPPEASALMSTSKFIRQYRSEIEEHLISMVFVVPSKIIRTVVGGMFALAPLPIPMHMVDTMSQAVDRLKVEFEKQGVAFPEGVDAFAETREPQE